MQGKCSDKKGNVAGVDGRIELERALQGVWEVGMGW